MKSVLKQYADSIQFGLLVLTGVGMLTGFWGYCETHFAHADVLENEIEERREMKAEIDDLYVRMIPREQQGLLKHHAVLPNRSSK